MIKEYNKRNSAKFMILGVIANLEKMRTNNKLTYNAGEKRSIIEARRILLGIIEGWSK